MSAILVASKPVRPSGNTPAVGRVLDFPGKARATPCAAPASDQISLVNLAARQRMLSQRMILKTMLAASGDAQALLVAQAALKLFSQSHVRLLATVSELDEAAARLVRNTYEGPEGVRTHIDSFIQDMEAVLASIAAGLPHGVPLSRVLSRSDGILEVLNTATTTFDNIAKGRSQSLMKELTSIVSDIQMVAREAKIVSFNAQVIAARAGTFGREFAVLASALSGIATEIDGLSRKGIELAQRGEVAS